MPTAMTETAIRAALKRAATEGKRRDLADAQAPGLRLRITPSGKGTWVLACRDQEGGMRRFQLGAWPTMGIADARREARDARGEVRKGADPIAERRAVVKAAKAEAEREKLTLSVLVGDWERMHLAKRSERYRVEAIRALQHAFVDQLEKPAEDLDRATVRRVLDAIDRRRSKVGNVTDRAAIQGRTVAYGRACYTWAVKREMVPVNPFLALPVPEAAPARERVLSDSELVEVLRAVGTEDNFGRIIWLLATTGQRRDEVSGMRWGEVSADLTTWTIPSSRTKNDKAQIVPLSAAAQEVFAGLDRGQPDALVFPSSNGTPFDGFAKAKARLDREIAKAREKAAAESGDKAQPMAPWRIHDVRRTVATGLQRLGVRLEVTEAVLNHVSGSRAGIVGVYQRHSWADEKRTALDAWGEHVTRLLAGPAEDTGNVVQLRTAG